MSGLCLDAGAGPEPVLPASERFTLAWVHSVEKTAWQEDWRIEHGRLVLDLARIRGTGAGMEPPAGARFEHGWWLYRPPLPPLPRIVLAASAFTADHQVCQAGRCRPLHSLVSVVGDQPIVLAPCPTAQTP